jgi:hypothetical protein
VTCRADCVAPSKTQCHCGSGCHRTFGSITGFDKHRRDGRCLDPDLAGLAMHLDAKGVWRIDGDRTAIAFGR